MPSYNLISSYVQDEGGLNLVIDFKGGGEHPGADTTLVTNQPTGADSQLWTVVDDPGGSGYVFLQSKVKDPHGNHLVIDIRGNVNTPNTPLDGYPRKSKDYNNQLWKFVPEITVPGYAFIQSIMNDPKGKPLAIDIRGASNKLGTTLDAYPEKSSGYDNQLWQLVPV